MSLHVRAARGDLGGGIVRAPRPKQNYDQISHEITRNVNLSYTAVGLLVRLLSNEDNVSQTADDLLREKKSNAKNRRGNGRRSILAALSELRLHGYLQTFITRADGGLCCTTSIVFDQPQPAPTGWRATATGVLHPIDSTTGVGDEPAQVIEKTGVRIPASGFSDAGMRTPIEVPREVPKEKSSSMRATRVPAPDAAAPRVKARRVRVSGLVTWYPEDVVASEILELQTPPSELAEAVDAEQAAGREPVPGRVACRLLQRRQAAQHAAAAEQAARRVAAIEEASRRRGDRDTAELMALKANQSKQERDL